VLANMQTQESIEMKRSARDLYAESFEQYPRYPRPYYRHRYYENRGYDAARDMNETTRTVVGGTVSLGSIAIMGGLLGSMLNR
jgi:hypothetical protein